MFSNRLKVMDQSFLNLVLKNQAKTAQTAVIVITIISVFHKMTFNLSKHRKHHRKKMRNKNKMNLLKINLTSMRVNKEQVHRRSRLSSHYNNLQIKIKSMILQIKVSSHYNNLQIKIKSMTLQIKVSSLRVKKKRKFQLLLKLIKNLRR